MKRYFQYKVTLNDGAEFQAKVTAENAKAFNDWLSYVPGVAESEEIKASYTLPPHGNSKSKLALARLNANMTQQEIADKLGVMIYTYQRWEHGLFKPKTATLMRLGEILNVDWTSLVE